MDGLPFMMALTQSLQVSVLPPGRGSSTQPVQQCTIFARAPRIERDVAKIKLAVQLCERESVCVWEWGWDGGIRGRVRGACVRVRV